MMMHPKYNVIFFAAFISLIYANDNNNIEPLQTNLEEYMLPDNISPSIYTIELTPYFEQGDVAQNKEPFTFDGQVDITFNVNENNLNQIILHKNKLNISEIILLQNGNQIAKPDLDNNLYNEATHKYTINLGLGVNLNMGITYALRISYVGELSEEMAGFYRSSYTSNNVRKWLGTTQMQATSARRVFPCLDEPKYKAKFELIMNRPLSFQSTISNTEIKEYNITADYRMKEIFHMTPTMSTYLLAFIVSEFNTWDTGRFTVYSRPEYLPLTTYASDVGVKLITALGQWLNYNYLDVQEITKMSMAAIPDFEAGAMENWGLLTYRETGLLYDPQVTTSISQQRIAAVIAHEQAHLWFGDLVTCDWWKYTWLNEGFARYFQYFGTHMVEADWDLPMQYVVEQIQGVFGADALLSTHPMNYDVYTPSQVSGIFNSISYSKGSAIIRMIEHLIGTDNFQAALVNYIKTNEFSTTTPDKLYTAFQRVVVGYNISEIMNSWTSQPGYPVVTVTVHDNKEQVSVSQKRFLIKDSNHSDTTLWNIPLNYATQESSNFTDTKNIHMLSDISISDISVGHTIDWIIFNKQQTGYYRVNYDTNNWNNIAKALQAVDHSDINTINRAQIVDDVMNLARANLIEYEVVFSILKYLENEENYIPWLSAFNNLAYIINRMNDTQLDIGKKYMLKLTEKIYKKLGFDTIENETRTDIYNRINILTYACRYGNEECLTRSQEYYKMILLNDTGSIPKDLRSVVYCTIIANNDEATWIYFWYRYVIATVPGEQLLILNALGCTTSESSIKKYIDYIYAGNYIRQQDKLAAFTSIYTANEANIQIVLNYVLAKYNDIPNGLSINTLLGGIASRLRHKEQIETIRTFLRDNSLPTILALDDAEYNIDWATDNLPEIEELMTKYVNTAMPIKSIGILILLSTLINHFT